MRDNGRVSTEPPPTSSQETSPATAPDPDAATPADPAKTGPALPPRRVVVVAAVAVLALALDILTKAWVVADLEGRPPIVLLGGLVYFDVIRNSGAAFSMATGMTWVLSLIALAVVVAIAWIAPRLRSVGWAIGLGLVLAGALGNLIDRLFRAPSPLQGHVVDFISLRWNGQPIFAVFNVADSCICVGGALIVLLAALGREYDGGLSKRARAAASSATGTDPE
jgi:signal peptidase II